MLADELEAIGKTATALARQIGMPANRLGQIIRGKRAVTGDTALRLGHWFRMSPRFWLNPQSQYELRLAEAASGTAVRKLPVRAA
jgi:addiction module HigA family antidote